VSAPTYKITESAHKIVESGIIVEILKKLEEACSMSWEEVAKWDGKFHFLTHALDQKDDLRVERQFIELKHDDFGCWHSQYRREVIEDEQERITELKQWWLDLRSEYG